VGDDPLGVRLVASLRADGVDTRCVAVRPRRRTGVTLVEVDDDGERRFFGFRENSADLSLGFDDVDTPAVRAVVARAAVVHTGTVSLRSPSARRATHALQAAARKTGAVVSLDVNLRPGMFSSVDLLLRLARRAVDRADVVKATREEAEQLLGVAPLAGRRTNARVRAHDEGLVDGLLALGPRLCCLTLAEEGALVATAAARAHAPSPPTRVVDATGAGDGFVGAVLAEVAAGDVARADLGALPESALHALAEVGCRAGAAVVTAMGASTAMLRGTPTGVLSGVVSGSPAGAPRERPAGRASSAPGVLRSGRSRR
jgi:fructokinase